MQFKRGMLEWDASTMNTHASIQQAVPFTAGSHSYTGKGVGKTLYVTAPAFLLPVKKKINQSLLVLDLLLVFSFLMSLR